MKQCTLNDIARVSGYTTGTVCKALNGSKGVKSDKREEIVRLAEEMGYQKLDLRKLSSRKRIAVLFPEANAEYRFFYSQLWSGVRARAKELLPMGFEITEYVFDGGKERQKEIMLEILDAVPRYDGMLTLIWDERFYLDILDEFFNRRIPVFTLSSDAPFSSRTASIISNSYKVGRLAAEYLGSVLHGRGRIIVASTKRNHHMFEQVAQGFYDQMEVSNPELEIIELYEGNMDEERFINNLEEFLTSFSDIRGIYANNAKATKLVGDFLSRPKIPNQSVVVGTELFSESIAYVKKGIINAIIDQRPFDQGFKGVSLAYDYICGKHEVRQINYLPPLLYLKNNLP